MANCGWLLQSYVPLATTSLTAIQTKKHTLSNMWAMSDLGGCLVSSNKQTVTTSRERICGSWTFWQIHLEWQTYEKSGSTDFINISAGSHYTADFLYTTVLWNTVKFRVWHLEGLYTEGGGWGDLSVYKTVSSTVLFSSDITEVSGYYFSLMPLRKTWIQIL